MSSSMLGTSQQPGHRTKGDKRQNRSGACRTKARRASPTHVYGCIFCTSRSLYRCRVEYGSRAYLYLYPLRAAAGPIVLATRHSSLLPTPIHSAHERTPQGTPLHKGTNQRPTTRAYREVPCLRAYLRAYVRANVPHDNGFEERKQAGFTVSRTSYLTAQYASPSSLPCLAEICLEPCAVLHLRV